MNVSCVLVMLIAQAHITLLTYVSELSVWYNSFMAVLHGTRIWMTDGGEFLEDEEAAEFHLLLVTAAFGRSD